MGWYRTCEYCGQESKNELPHCKCAKKRRQSLLKKLIGSKIVTCSINYDECGNTILYTKYKKNGEYFCTQTVLDPGGEYSPTEALSEIQIEEYPSD